MATFSKGAAKQFTTFATPYITDYAQGGITAYTYTFYLPVNCIPLAYVFRNTDNVYDSGTDIKFVREGTRFVQTAVSNGGGFQWAVVLQMNVHGHYLSDGEGNYNILVNYVFDGQAFCDIWYQEVTDPTF